MKLFDIGHIPGRKQCCWRHQPLIQALCLSDQDQITAAKIPTNGKRRQGQKEMASEERSGRKKDNNGFEIVRMRMFFFLHFATVSFLYIIVSLSTLMAREYLCMYTDQLVLFDWPVISMLRAVGGGLSSLVAFY